MMKMYFNQTHVTKKLTKRREFQEYSLRLIKLKKDYKFQSFGIVIFNVIPYKIRLLASDNIQLYLSSYNSLTYPCSIFLESGNVICVAKITRRLKFYLFLNKTMIQKLLTNGFTCIFETIKS